MGLDHRVRFVMLVLLVWWSVLVLEIGGSRGSMPQICSVLDLSLSFLDVPCARL